MGIRKKKLKIEVSMADLQMTCGEAMAWNWNGSNWDPKRESLSWWLFFLAPFVAAIIVMIMVATLQVPGIRFLVEHPLLFVFVTAMIVAVGIIVIFCRGKHDKQNKEQ